MIPKVLQRIFQNCWAVSDNRPSFEQALQGAEGFTWPKVIGAAMWPWIIAASVFPFTLAEGQNQGLSGAPGRSDESLPSTSEVKAHIAQRMSEKLRGYIEQAQGRLKQQVGPFIQKKKSLQHQQRNERSRLQQ
jgi:hypothetical protein